MFRCNLTRSLLQRVSAPRTASIHPSRLPPKYTRSLSSTSCHLYPQKDSQDKDSLKPRSSEYSKTGGDDAAAESDTAFNPNQTKPETEEASAEAESSGSSSLNASPGNKKVSEPNDPEAGGADHGVRTKQSGGGSGNKSGGSSSG